MSTSETQTRHQYHRVTWMLGVGVLLAVGGFVALVAAGGREAEQAWLPILLFVFLVPMTLAARWRSGKVDALIEKMRGGERIIGWDLSAAEHDRFLDTSFKRRLQVSLGAAVLIPLLFVGIFVVASIASGKGFGWASESWFWLTIVGSGIGAFALGALSGILGRAPLRGASCEVFIGEKGIYRTGRFLRTQGLGVKLQGATYLPAETPGEIPMLEVQVVQRIAHKKEEQSICIPLTGGQAEQAPEIIARLSKSDTSLNKLSDVLGEFL